MSYCARTDDQVVAKWSMRGSKSLLAKAHSHAETDLFLNIVVELVELSSGERGPLNRSGDLEGAVLLFEDFCLRSRIISFFGEAEPFESLKGLEEDQ